MKQQLKFLYYVCLILITISSCSEAPTQFSEAVLNDTFITVKGDSVTLKKILEKHQGKQTVINVWASWCRDCIVGIPDIKVLQRDFPETDFVFLSVDRNQDIWKRSIPKYNTKGDHYFIPDGQEGVFGDFLNSNWIPRYLVIDTNRNITLFKAKKATDKALKKVLQ